MLYLDHSATTPPYPEVAVTVADVMGKYFGNPSSIHRLGVEAEQLLNRSRKAAAAGMFCKPEEIIFTASGSESNNLALKGVAARYSGRGRHIITSSVEHASVHECLVQLEAQGYEVTYLPVDATGSIHLAELEQAIRPDTILVSLMYVNSEVGRIQPVQAVGRLLAAYPRILFHVDAIQAFGKLDCRPEQLGCDLLSVSGHKFRGPRGAAWLYCREGVELMPLVAGGGQERGRRAGTENVPALVGLAKAVRFAGERRVADTARLYSLRRFLTARLAELEGVSLSGTDDPQEMAPHIVHFTLAGIRSEVMVHALEEADIYISTRSACSSGSIKPSRTLLAMGKSREEASSGLRVSFSADQTEAELEQFAAALEQAIRQIRV